MSRTITTATTLVTLAAIAVGSWAQAPYSAPPSAPVDASVGQEPTGPVYSGPRCTIAYPHGFNVARGTKVVKGQEANICDNSKIDADWSFCAQGYRVTPNNIGEVNEK